MCVCMCACMRASVHVCVYMHMCVCVYMHSCMCIHACVCVCLCVCMCVCVCARTRLHASLYVCIFMCVLACVWICVCIYMCSNANERKSMLSIKCWWHIPLNKGLIYILCMEVVPCERFKNFRTIMRACFETSCKSCMSFVERFVIFCILNWEVHYWA